MGGKQYGLSVARMLAACVVLLTGGGPVGAAGVIDDWRNEATRIRILAENDAPRAYERARQLEATLPAAATAADRARALNLLSRIEAYLALTEPAAAHAQQAFELAEKNGDRIGQAEADLNVALNSINQGKLDELVRVTQHSVVILEGVDRPDLLGEAMLRTAVMFRRFEDFDESVAVAVQAMEIARRTSHPLALAYAEHGMAIAFDQNDRPVETREHYQQMRKHAQAARSRLLEGFAVAGLASAQIKHGDLAGAERLSREAITIYREVGAPFSISFGLYGLANNLALQGRHREAVATLDEALAIYARYPNPIGLWFALNARSGSHEAMGDLARAQADAERAYELAKDLGHAIYLRESATRLASIAAARGDFRRAYALANEHAQMASKATREKAGERMLRLIQRYEKEGKQREIDELTRRNEQQNARLRQRELQQGWMWTVLVGVALLLIGSMLFMLRLRQSHRQLQALNQQLLRSENDVRALNVGLEQRVQERTAELDLRKRYLRTLINVLPMWAWFKDTEGRYLVVSQAQAEASGHSVEEMEGKTDFELLPEAEAQRRLAEDREVLASRQRKTGEECVRVGGSEQWLETYKAAVLDEDGTVLGTVGVARDISERHAAEAARESALAEARQLARQRSEFLAQMSHELRTPLNGILGFAQILRRDKPLTERQTRGLKIIEDCGQQLLALINDILDLARIDAAKLDLYPSDVDVAVFLQVLSDIVRVKAEEKSLLFACELAPDLPRIMRVDEKRLRQVLLNLLSNAVKFTDAGRVTLRVTRARPVAGRPAARGRCDGQSALRSPGRRHRHERRADGAAVCALRTGGRVPSARGRHRARAGDQPAAGAPDGRRHRRAQPAGRRQRLLVRDRRAGTGSAASPAARTRRAGRLRGRAPQDPGGRRPAAEPCHAGRHAGHPGLRDGRSRRRRAGPRGGGELPARSHPHGRDDAGDGRPRSDAPAAADGGRRERAHHHHDGQRDRAGGSRQSRGRREPLRRQAHRPSDAAG